MNIDAITEAAIEAANEAIQETIQDAMVYSVHTGVIEEAVEEAIQEAIEKDREERKAEQPFTFSELMDLRRGIHKLRLQDIEDRSAQFGVAIEFGIDLESDKWKEFKMKRDVELAALYDKLGELVDKLNYK